MSGIEKMYENAELLYCNKCRHDSEIDCIYMCEGKHPPFTAKKQIELIKWLSDFADFGTFSIDHDKSEYGIAFCVNDDGYYFVDKIFEECIAKVVKNLWQSLTEEEKGVLRGILRA